MRFYILFLLVLVLNVCYRTTYRHSYVAPSWASDNKIVFIEVYREIRHYKEITGERTVVVKRECYLWEVDLSQSYRRIVKIADDDPGITNVSSVGDWVVLGCSYWGDNGEIWVIKRDGTGLRKVTNGKYPDFSPDGSKIVFVRDDGLYIINRDGSGLKRVFSDSLAFWPVWSKDGTKISFDLFRQPGLFIIDTVGIIIKQYNFNASSSSWSVLPDSLAFLDLDDHKIKIISIVSDSIKTLNIETRSSIRWSIDGRYFIVGTTIRDREGNLIFTIAP